MLGDGEITAVDIADQMQFHRRECLLNAVHGVQTVDEFVVA